jgi:hypothetical protein
MELAQLVASCVEEASRPLREEVASLRLLLARVVDSLEPTEACSSRGQKLDTVQDLFPLGSSDHKSHVVEEQHLYGCFFPRGSPCKLPQPVLLASSESVDMNKV